MRGSQFLLLLLTPAVLWGAEPLLCQRVSRDLKDGKPEVGLAGGAEHGPSSRLEFILQRYGDRKGHALSTEPAGAALVDLVCSPSGVMAHRTLVLSLAMRELGDSGDADRHTQPDIDGYWDVYLPDTKLDTDLLRALRFEYSTTALRDSLADGSFRENAAIRRDVYDITSSLFALYPDDETAGNMWFLTATLILINDGCKDEAELRWDWPSFSSAVRSQPAASGIDEQALVCVSCYVASARIALIEAVKSELEEEADGLKEVLDSSMLPSADKTWIFPDPQDH